MKQSKGTGNFILQVSGTLARATGLLINYELSGNVDDVLLPALGSSSCRRNGL